MPVRHLIAMAVALLLATPSHALITGGKDEDVQVSNLPQGAIELANSDSRIAWWEGPPFGGGQYHFEYVGETPELQKSVDLFAKVDSKRKQIVIRQGRKDSFWLSIGNTGTKRHIDWQFMVWVPGNWNHLRGARAGLLPPGQEGESPLTQLTVFASERVDWASIKVPEGLTVIDERLEANGLSAEDGAALRVKILDAARQPIVGARIHLGKDDATKEAVCDSQGSATITNISAGNHRITVAAEGYATKDLYYHSFDTFTYRELSTELAEAAAITVQVVDHNGQPLKDIDVMISNCVDSRGDHYRIGGEQNFRTDSAGEFRTDDVPVGKIRFACRTAGYYYNSVLNEHVTGEEVIQLSFLPTGDVKVAVASPNGLPVTSRYNVEIHEKGTDPIKGGKVGSWGGSANIGSDGTYTFKNVPPGEYEVTGKPNPGRTSDRTKPVAVTVKGNDDHQINLTAR